MNKKINHIFILNGKVKEADKDFISVKNSGFLYGDGCFETIRVYKGNIFLLEDHIERLYSSLCFFNYRNIDLNFLREDIKRSIKILLEAKGLSGKDAFLKVIISRGEYGKRLDLESGSEHTTIVFADSYTGYPSSFYEKGIEMIISSIKRQESSNNIYRHKTLNYLENIFAKNEAKSKGAQEALFVSASNTVLEGAVSNIFMVKKNILFTTSLDFNILPGITRKKILELCVKNDIAFNECRLSLDDFLNADEIFITNSLAEILPVSKIEGRNLRGKIPGKFTKTLSFLYKEEIKRLTQ
ncbi:MAG: aminodeoxychorismate lyase [Actinomycetota bacterium]|jgi:branched-chain amino acid aminotransferase|nr:aminodeoxychorismate lyase [Actinomycetota bacterium]